VSWFLSFFGFFFPLSFFFLFLGRGKGADGRAPSFLDSIERVAAVKYVPSDGRWSKFTVGMMAHFPPQTIF
jgi:hypothetical protein